MKIIKHITLLFLLIFSAPKLLAQVDTLFYFAPPWVTPDHDNKRPVKFHISTFSAPSTTIWIKQPASPLSMDTSFVVGPAQLVDVTYWRGAATSTSNLSYDSLETRPANVVRTNGVRIRSSQKITILFDEITLTPNNPETYSLKGQNAFGTEFVCPFQTKWNNKILTSDVNGDGFVTLPKSQINIVATQSNTIVWITPKCNVVGHAANVTYSVYLPVEGACYTAENVTTQSSITGQNLSGSIVVSNKPVAVTVSDDSVNPGSGSGQTCYDLMGDQIVPVELVGTDYIVNRGRLNAQTGEAFFVVATQNFTQLQIIGAGTITAMMNKGDTYLHNLNADMTYIKADKNVYLLHASGYGCELGEALLPPLNCAGSDSVTFTRNNADTFFVNLLCKQAAINSFTLATPASTAAISAALFTVVPATSTLQGGPYYGAQLGPFSTVQIAPNTSNLIFNSAGSNGFFAMGVICGRPTSGTLFHYMSSFLRKTSIKTQTLQAICAGQSSLVPVTGTIAGAAITGVWSTSYQSGSVTVQGGGSGSFTGYSSATGVISTSYIVGPGDTTYSGSPTKTITLFLTSTGLCKNVRDSIVLTIFQKPIVSVSAGTLMCKNNVSPIALSGTVTNAVTGAWSGGNGGIFGVPGIVTTYTPSLADINSGILTLSLTSLIPLPGCPNVIQTMSVGFQNPPIVSVVPTVTQVCTNSTTLALNGNVSGITTTGVWIGGSGAFLPNNFNPVATYVLSAADLSLPFITLTLTSTNNSLCASESATIHINIIPKPDLTLPLNPDPICAGLGSVALTGTISGLSPQGTWLAGGTGSIVQGSQSGTITATYFLGSGDIAAGIVNFSLQSQGGVCPAETVTMDLSILEPPLVQVEQNFIPVCNNAPVALSGTITGYTTSGIWTTSSASSTPGTFTPSPTSLSTIYVPSVADINNGFVILTLNSTSNGICPASQAALTASFVPAPKADFLIFGKRCLSSPLSFSADAQANGTSQLQYVWDFGDGGGSGSTVQNPIKTYSAPGQYLVTLTVTGTSALNLQCPDTIQKYIIVKPLPVALFTTPPACEGIAVTFTNKSYIPPGADPILRWEYYFGDKDTSNNRVVTNNPAPVTHNYKIPGSYIAALTVTSAVPGTDISLGCVSETQYLTIDVNINPVARFGMTNNPSLVQEPIYFSDFSTPQENLATWYWQFGDDDASTEKAPSHSYLSPGIFTIVLTVIDNGGCMDTASRVIDITMLPNVPSGFSPNGDGLNDILYVKGGPFESLLFRVYDNWGTLLFETTDQKIGWDGRWNGTLQPSGVYVWTLVADIYNNRQVKKNGDITIVR